MYPMQVRADGCGDGEYGVRTLTPPTDGKASVNCYGVKPRSGALPYFQSTTDTSQNIYSYYDAKKKEVFQPDIGYTKTSGEADSVCRQYNSTVSNFQQLIDAVGNGAQWCSTGWTKNDSGNLVGMYPMQVSAPDCGDGGYGVRTLTPPTDGKASVNCYGVKPRSGALPYFQSTTDTSQNIYSYYDAKKKEVFQPDIGYTKTSGEADSVCRQYNSTVSNFQQLIDAVGNGAQWCSTGWTKNDSGNLVGMYPMQVSAPDCGDGGYGVREWTPTDGKASVNCYGVKPQIEGALPYFQSTTTDPNIYSYYYNCSDNGKYNNETIKCLCNNTFNGDKCQYSDYKTCSDHGTVDTYGKCTCSSSGVYGGNNCEINLQTDKLNCGYIGNNCMYLCENGKCTNPIGDCSTGENPLCTLPGDPGSSYGYLYILFTNGFSAHSDNYVLKGSDYSVSGGDQVTTFFNNWKTGQGDDIVPAGYLYGTETANTEIIVNFSVTNKITNKQQYIRIYYSKDNFNMSVSNINSLEEDTSTGTNYSNYKYFQPTAETPTPAVVIIGPPL